jgi:hypothetical protein
MATEKVVIVDTDATQSPHYTSLRSAIHGEAGATPLVVTSANLVANDEQVTFECRASAGAADNIAGNLIQSNLFTTSADCHVKVYVPPAHRHDGKWNTGKYRITSTTNVFGGSANPVTGHWIIEGVQASTTLSAGLVFRASTDMRLLDVSQCVFVGPSSTAGTGSVLFVYNHGDQVVRFRNNVMYEFYRAITNSGAGTTPTWYVENNTISRCSNRGVSLSYVGTLYLRNNIVTDTNDGDDFNISNIGTTHRNNNISSDATATGTGSLINQISTDLFADYAAYDFSLKAGSNAIDAGADLSAVMDSVDIIGTVRPQGEAWDIGAWEYVASGITRPAGQIVVTRYHDIDRGGPD